jgi:hypothetical protein
MVIRYRDIEQTLTGGKCDIALYRPYADSADEGQFQLYYDEDSEFVNRMLTITRTPEVAGESDEVASRFS